MARGRKTKPIYLVEGKVYEIVEYTEEHWKKSLEFSPLVERIGDLVYCNQVGYSNSSIDKGSFAKWIGFRGSFFAELIVKPVSLKTEKHFKSLIGV